MNVTKMGSYNRIDILRRKFLFEKIWLFINGFIFLPAITWLFFVYLGPLAEPLKNNPLSAWITFWGVAATTCEGVYCCFIVNKINHYRMKVDSTEWSMSNK